MTEREQVVAARRVLLAVCVLDGLDVVPTEEGIQVGLVCGTGPVLAWSAAADVLGELPSAHEAARIRLRSWLRQHELLAFAGAEAVREALRPLALSPGSALRPDGGWTRRRVPGGALELGFGVVEGRTAVPTGGDVTLVTPLWPDVAAALTQDPGSPDHPGAPARSVDLDEAWARVMGRLEAMGDLAGRRTRRRGDEVLAAAGGCDVPTLLCSVSLREHLLADDPAGMRGVAAPTRSRGWSDRTRIDTDFVAAAWHATDVEDQGLAHPLLVTADEVALALAPHQS